MRLHRISNGGVAWCWRDRVCAWARICCTTHPYTARFTMYVCVHTLCCPSDLLVENACVSHVASVHSIVQHNTYCLHICIQYMYEHYFQNHLSSLLRGPMVFAPNFDQQVCFLLLSCATHEWKGAVAVVAMCCAFAKQLKLSPCNLLF